MGIPKDQSRGKMKNVKEQCCRVSTNCVRNERNLKKNGYHKFCTEMTICLRAGNQAFLINMQFLL